MPKEKKPKEQVKKAAERSNRKKEIKLASQATGVESLKGTEKKLPVLRGINSKPKKNEIIDTIYSEERKLVGLSTDPTHARESVGPKEELIPVQDPWFINKSRSKRKFRQQPSTSSRSRTA